jgi:thiazole/oxazole-forming peptide maturase SagD family component
MKRGEQEGQREKFYSNSNRGRVVLEDTLQRYARFLDERTGIFASHRKYDLPWESPVHVCAGLLKAEFCRSAHGARPAISSTVCGSGASAEQANVSCLCEALERLSGIFRGDEPRRKAFYSEIANEAIHPAALTLFSQSQYHDREQWNRREGRYNWVPEQFDPERQIDWTPAWSLTHQKAKYLPTAYCYFGYPFDPAHDFCRPDSNGNAAGQSLDEAIVHGFLELVERECASVWWYNRIRRPRVEVASFSAPEVVAVCDLHRLLGRSLAVLDITAERTIPTFVAISREVRSPENYALGFGAHLDAQIALTKAMMELTQFLPVVMQHRDPGCFLSAAEGQSDMSFLTPAEQAVTLSSHFPAPVSREPRQEVVCCVELAKSWRLEMLVVDQTREDFGMPVVKVVVPGMRGWWARFAPGRLYALPVQLGWLSEPQTEAHLNPCHLVL